MRRPLKRHDGKHDEILDTTSSPGATPPSSKKKRRRIDHCEDNFEGI